MLGISVYGLKSQLAIGKLVKWKELNLSFA